MRNRTVEKETVFIPESSRWAQKSPLAMLLLLILPLRKLDRLLLQLLYRVRAGVDVAPVRLDLDVGCQSASLRFLVFPYSIRTRTWAWAWGKVRTSGIVRTMLSLSLAISSCQCPLPSFCFWICSFLMRSASSARSSLSGVYKRGQLFHPIANRQTVPP